MTTITQLFASAVAARETEPALRTADGTIAWTWGDYGRQAAAAATGLSALGVGVGGGDVVACWLSNRPEFHAADMGAALIGAASFSVYPTYTAEQAAHVIGDAASSVLITEPAFLERALEVRSGGATAQIKRFAVLEEDWVPGGDELTATSKLKRRVIADKYQDRIDALYV